MEQQRFPISGVESQQGRRVSMEDTHKSIDDVKKMFPEAPESSYYGVYDGHGGKEAALKCEDWLHESIIQDPSFVSGNIEEAIKNGFQQTDKKILEFSEKEEWKSGTTVVVAIIHDGKLYVANAGDSEAVLAQRGGEKFQSSVLSHKHKPGDSEEKERIKAAGGHVVFGRVMGSLAVARALGDRDFKHPYNKGSADFVSAEPFITCMPIPSDADFLLVSCDGLWDKMSYEDAVEFVGQCRDAGDSPQEAAQKVVQEALNKGTLDNVTCIVVYFPETRSKAQSNGNKKKEKKKTLEEECDNEDEEEEELLDAYEFLRMDDDEIESIMKTMDKLRHFELEKNEDLLADYSCTLGQKILHQGALLLTERHLCFFSIVLKKKIKRQMRYEDIVHVEKVRGMFVANGLRVTTRDGKKHVFNWKQGPTPRDIAFTKLIELTGISPDDNIIPHIDSDEPNNSDTKQINEKKEADEKKKETDEKKKEADEKKKEADEKKKETDEKSDEKEKKSESDKKKSDETSPNEMSPKGQRKSQKKTKKKKSATKKERDAAEGKEKSHESDKSDSNKDENESEKNEREKNEPEPDKSDSDSDNPDKNESTQNWSRFD